MRKFAFLLLPFALLLAPAVASAKVPSFNQTSQYQSLSSYVTFLQGLENTPATTEQKNTYTANLTIRVNNANSRVAELNTQRKTQAKNDFSRQKTKILKSVKATAKSQRKQALATYKKYSQEEWAIYQGEVNSIQATYDDDISRVNRQIKSLNKQLDKTNNAAKMLRLERKINKLEDQVAGYKKARIKAKNAAQARYQKAAADERAAYQKRLDRISRRFQQNLNKRNSQARNTYNQRLGKIADINDREKNTVLNLQTRGQLYIANMPSAS